MLIIFEFKDDFITAEQAGDLAVKSPFWTFATKWRVQPGTIDFDVTTPEPAEEIVNVTPSMTRKEKRKKPMQGEGNHGQPQP